LGWASCKVWRLKASVVVVFCLLRGCLNTFRTSVLRHSTLRLSTFAVLMELKLNSAGGRGFSILGWKGGKSMGLIKCYILTCLSSYCSRSSSAAWESGIASVWFVIDRCSFSFRFTLLCFFTSFNDLRVDLKDILSASFSSSMSFGETLANVSTARTFLSVLSGE